MPRIDRFIKPLFQIGGQRIVMAAGEKVTLSTPAGPRYMTTEEATPAQIEGFLKEILPDTLSRIVASGKPGAFDYASPHGAVRVGVTHEPGLKLELSSAGRAQATASPAEPSPPRSQDMATPPGRSPATANRQGEPAINALFHTMVTQGCSDLHLSSGNPPLFRKDGDITALGDTTPLTPEQAEKILLAITPPKFREEFEACHDVDFSYEIAGLARFRCNLFRDRLGMGGVFRIIPTKIPSAEQLGLSKQILELCHLPKGLVVVTGPTGSGKSTTLAAMIDYINTNLNAHIITIEDPLEFVHSNKKCLVNQREVGTHTQGFKAALRAALREDPDIVLVGEMRDLETVAIAIETAETGHLVFGTLHTNTAPSTVDRIIDQFPTDRQAQVRVMLSESLKGVIAQTLCRKKGGGRIAAQEILIVNSAVSNLIREGKTFQIHSIMQTGKGAGMVCMNDALLDLVRRGQVESDEALSRSIHRNELKSMLERSASKAAAVVGG